MSDEYPLATKVPNLPFYDDALCPSVVLLAMS